MVPSHDHEEKPFAPNLHCKRGKYTNINLASHAISILSSITELIPQVLDLLLKLEQTAAGFLYLQEFQMEYHRWMSSISGIHHLGGLTS